MKGDEIGQFGGEAAWKTAAAPTGPHSHFMAACNLCREQKAGEPCPEGQGCPLTFVVGTSGLCLNCLALIRAGIDHVDPGETTLH